VKALCQQVNNANYEQNPNVCNTVHKCKTEQHIKNASKRAVTNKARNFKRSTDKCSQQKENAKFANQYLSTHKKGVWHEATFLVQTNNETQITKFNEDDITYICSTMYTT
jgi:hypothetical protein